MSGKRVYIDGIRVIPTEDQEQIAVFQWAELMQGRWPELALMHHIPNGGKRSKAEAGRFKAMGVKAGVSDIFLPVPRGGWHGLYVEMKAVDGVLSAPQREWLAAVRKQGYFGAVCKGAGEAVGVIERYLKGEMA